MSVVVISILLATAAFLAAIGMHSIVRLRMQKDAEWVRQTAHRFSPYPINVTLWLAAYYGTLVFVLVVVIWLAPNLAFALVLWASLLLLPKPIVEWFWRRRRRQIDLQLPAAIASMSNCIRAGLTLVQSIQRLSEQAPDPIRTEFRVMANRYAHGEDLERVIVETRRRLSLENFNLFASAMLVNRQMGGDIAQTLERISRSLEKLKIMRRTVEAHTSEGRTNIRVLLAAPVLMLLLLATVDAEGVGMLLNTPQGWCVLALAAALSGSGVFWASRIIHSDV